MAVRKPPKRVRDKEADTLNKYLKAQNACKKRRRFWVNLVKEHGYDNTFTIILTRGQFYQADTGWDPDNDFLYEASCDLDWLWHTVEPLWLWHTVEPLYSGCWQRFPPEEVKSRLRRAVFGE